MSRGRGFDHADIDAGLLDDPKFRALARSIRDEGVLARCCIGYVAVVTGSWSAGDRVSLDEAAPVWLTALDDLRERLQAVGLLDGDGRIPAHAWESWFRPADGRREVLRDKWRRANQRRSRSGTNGGTAAVQRRSNGGTAAPGHDTTGQSRQDGHDTSLRPPIVLHGRRTDGRELAVEGIGEQRV